MGTSILEVIQHYQRAIERSPDEERLLHCINKLYKLPVKVEHLQETGIGKTVNSLRKYNGEIGVAAKALVTKWKAMVAAEEEPMETNCQSTEEGTNNGNGRHSSDDEHDDNQRNSNNNNCKERATDQKATEERNSNTSKEKDKHRRRDDEKEVSSTSKESKHTSRSTDHSNEKSSSSNGHAHTSKSKSKEIQQEVSEKSRESGEKQQKHHKSREEHGSTKDREKDKERQHETSKSREHQRATSRDKERGTEKRKDLDKHKSGRSGSHGRDGSSSSKTKSEHEHTGASTSHHSSSKERGHEKRENKHKDSEKPASSSKDKHSERKSKESKHDKDKKSASSTHATSSKDKEHRSSSKTKSSAAKTERKRSLLSDDDDDDDANDASSPQAPAKKAKTEQKQSDEDADDGIDSSMGANFADVLGMLNVPSKKSKKSLQATSFKSPTATPSSSKSSSSNSKESSSKTPLNSSKVSSSSSKLSAPKAAASTSSAASRSPNTKPELLSSKTKLEPLDPSIVLDLPTISTNYKPMPLNQTVMDCVFNNYNASGSSTSRTPARTLTDAEAISHGISSKTMRTKIYSGVKTGQILQVPSLFDLCIRVLQKNIDALEYTGGVPFEVLRSVLERATPQQLLTFEDYNPYLMEDSDVLWRLHVQRNYRCQKRQEMESWREMYLRCQEEEERKLNILAENIKQSQKIIAAPVRKTQLAFIDSMVKPPRNVLRKQEQYGTKSKLIATPASRVAALSSVTPNAAKTGDTRLRVPVAVRDHAQVSHGTARPKKAPLMAKTLQLMRGRHKR